MLRLRTQNKVLSDNIAKIKKNETESSVGGFTPLEKLDHQICELHRKYDELQAEARSKDSKLTEMRNQLINMKKDADVAKTQVQDSPQANVFYSLFQLGN